MAELWTVQRTARQLMVTPKRIYQYIRMGRLDSVKLGPRATRVTRESVDRFLAELVARQKRELGLDIKPMGLHPHKSVPKPRPR
ncbi:MAG: helix-turn-helix domain-containing protein [Candidatus Sumerlaeaceae bacterium]|nr:helix-turn-helix domain-containing protein [Candidatus Sumerlaeaceae bacterium]